MKKWTIPAKTFMLGEYAAIAGAPAILLTTSPCFELTLLNNKRGLHGIHPQSPAGRWWLKHGHADLGLGWYDPYQGCGGMGASSAQFLGAYLATIHLQSKKAVQHEMLEAYFQAAWQGEGLRPSGYDVIAQSQYGCVFIDRANEHYQNMSWPFADIAFLLLHTGQKLATHHHLQAMTLPKHLNQLSGIVDKAKTAFELKDSQGIIEAVNAYQHHLMHMNLVAEHSIQYIETLKRRSEVLAAKGCGAMGSDVLLLIVPTSERQTLTKHLSEQGWRIVASNKDLYTAATLIENNF